MGERPTLKRSENKVETREGNILHGSWELEPTHADETGLNIHYSIGD